MENKLRRLILLMYKKHTQLEVINPKFSRVGKKFNMHIDLDGTKISPTHKNYDIEYYKLVLQHLPKILNELQSLVGITLNKIIINWIDKDTDFMKLYKLVTYHWSNIEDEEGEPLGLTSDYGLQDVIYHYADAIECDKKMHTLVVMSFVYTFSEDMSGHYHIDFATEYISDLIDNESMLGLSVKYE